MSRDPFERLALREERLARKRLDDPRTFMSLALRFFAFLGVGWGALVGAHWLFFATPRWLALTHTIVFVLTVGYWAAAAVFLRVVRKRMPEMFDDR